MPNKTPAKAASKTPTRRKNPISTAGKKRSARALKSWETRRANAAAKQVAPEAAPAPPAPSEAPAPAPAPDAAPDAEFKVENGEG